MKIISFERGSFIERMKYRLIPSYRRKVNAETKAAIRWLLEHPEAPCIVDGYYIPNGYGYGSTINPTFGLF